MYCLVQGCRFPDSHLTEAHVCGICYNFGHGQNEHNIPESMELLKKKLSETIIVFPVENYCTIMSCDSKSTHHISAHHCKTCGRREHDSFNCINADIFNINPYLPSPYKKVETIFGDKDGKIYTYISAGMGCIWYARRLARDKEIEIAFLHNDNCGQYGQDDRDIIAYFISNCTNC